MNAAAAIAPPRRRCPRSPFAASATARPGHGEEQSGHRAAERAERGQHHREDRSAPLQREQRREPERHADRERQPGGQQQGGAADSEPERAEAPLEVEVPARERLEQRRRGHRGHSQRERGPEQPGDRRRDDAVRGRVVAAVPLAVPDRETFLAEEIRRKVCAARSTVRGCQIR